MTTDEREAVKVGLEVIELNINDIRKRLNVNNVPINSIRINLDNIETWTQRIKEVAGIPVEELI